MKNKLIFILIPFLLFSVLLYPQETITDNFGIQWDENDHSFDFYYMDKGNPVSLFNYTSTQKSFLSLYLNGEFISPENSPLFTGSFSGGEKKGEFQWSSESLLVTQAYSLSSDGRLTITVTILNRSNKSIQTGVKIIVNNNYEEENRYALSRNGSITINDNETGFSPDGFNVAFISGPLNRHQKKTYMLKIVENLPEKIVVSNIDRLEEAGYTFLEQNGRNFNYSPYSLNDSALMLLYAKRDVPGGGDYSLKIAFSAIDTVSSRNEIIIPTVTQESTEEKNSVSLQIPETVSTIQSISTGETLEKAIEIKKIIDSLYMPGMLTERSLLALEELIDNLEKPIKNENTE